ncbi:MAG: hypothetical protein FWH26_02070 [Oscillospiraceae bacterium]|nr:hypothetical protein [Oscillospiraceae bacterium]
MICFPARPKRLFRLLALLSLSALLLTACGPAPLAGETRPAEPAEINISSGDILRVEPGMTWRQVYDLLGSTAYYYSERSAPNFFSYLVDEHLRYVQTFREWEDICEAPGQELLARIREENTERPPVFADPAAVREEARKAVFGSRGWELLFASEDYVYAAYSEYGPCILRYNIAENRIDRALDITGPQRFFFLARFHTLFSPDGRELLFWNEVHWIHGEPVRSTLKLPYPATFLYRVDFEAGTAARAAEALKAEWGAGDTRARESGFVFDIEGYTADPQATLAISGELCAAMICRKDRTGELGYYEFAVIDRRDHSVLQKCAVN